MVGGGVRGKGVGIAHGTTTRVGFTIKAYHLFIEGYHQVGEMTTGTIVGEVINGTTSQSPKDNFNRTGAPGKRTSIGRNKIPGVSRV